MSKFERILKTNQQHLLIEESFSKLGEIKSNRLVIEEEKNKNVNGALKELTIEDIPDDSIAFTFDIRNNPLSWLIESNHPQANKKCDFILISPGEQEYKNKHVFVFGEIKSKNIDEEIYKFQLLNTFLFTNYIIDLINNYHNEEMEKILINDINIVSKFVVISNSTDIKKMSPPSLMSISSKNSNSTYVKTHQVAVLEAKQNQAGQGTSSTKFVERGTVRYQELLGEREV